MLFLFSIGVLLFVVVYFWFTYFRVPGYMKHLPVIPSVISRPSERLKAAQEISKTHLLARTWSRKWSVVVLHPEHAKTVYMNHTLFEKTENGKTLPRWSFLRQFFGESLVGADTDVWKQHRVVVNPAFEPQYIREFTTAFVEVGDTLLKELSKYGPEKPVPIHDWMQRYTLDCLGKTVFGYDFQSLTNENSVYAQTYHRIVSPKGVFFPLRFLVPSALFDLLPTPGNIRLKKDLATWNELMNKMLKRAQDSGADHDLAGHLVKSTLPGATHTLTTEQVRGNMSLFFLAGHETSATSVATTLWYLGRYPEFQDKVYAEIVSVCGKTDNPTFDTQKELHYLTHVMFEANRLTSPASALQRFTTEATELAGCQLPKGAAVIVEIDSIHRLEREWPNPTEFNPDRFGSDEKNRHSFAWQAFGMGARACLGRNFSILEQRVVLAKILQTYRIGLPAGSKPTLELYDGLGAPLPRMLSTITIQKRD